MAKKQQQKKPKTDWRRIFVAVLAGVLALLMLLPMIVMVLGGTAGAVTQEEIDALKAQRTESQARQQELKDQLAELKAGLEEAQKKRQLLVEQLESINTELENINAQIDWYDAQIADYDAQIAEKEAQRLEAVAREEAQYDLFCRRVRAMEESGTVSYWSILFSAESFSDMLDRMADISDIMAYDQAVMDQLVATRQEIEQIKAELEAVKAEQEAARADLKVIQGELEAKQAEHQSLVAEAQKLLDQINADTAEVNRQLDAESAAAQAIQASIIKKQKELEEERRRNNIIINSESGYMWPLPGYYRLTSLFGYRIHPITGKAHSHTGIDIPAPAGTPILAAKSGQVVTSGRHSSYGNYVVIDHGNGNSTLYAHMSSRAVKEGEMVTQGQTIGYVGSTGSSTGNHLHLEVRDNYSRVNPEKKYSGLNLTHPW